MDSPIRTQLFPGVWLTSIQTSKFKTGYFSIHLLTPLTAQDAAPNALLPFVLRRGTNSFPDLRSISDRLLELYGGVVEPSIRKRGEVQCLGFAASFLDDAFAAGTPVAECAISLLGDLLLRPNTHNGRFRSEYVESEKKNLSDMIQSQINQKRTYSIQRLTEEMFSGQPFGVDRLGKAETLAKLNNLKLYQRWLRLVQYSPIELYYCGSLPASRVVSAWKEALFGLPRILEYSPLTEMPQIQPKAVREFTDHLNVTQGKLVLGFRTGCTLTSPDYPALLVMNAAFGASTNSRLFLHVREKLSLCYYASSMVDKHAGILYVSSGVEFDNIPQAREEILAQLEAIRQGELSQAELNSAKKYVVNGLRTMNDAQGQLESFLFSQSLGGVDMTPDQLAVLCQAVTGPQVVSAAQRVTLDSVYVLRDQQTQEEAQTHD